MHMPVPNLASSRQYSQEEQIAWRCSYSLRLRTLNPTFARPTMALLKLAVKAVTV